MKDFRRIDGNYSWNHKEKIIKEDIKKNKKVNEIRKKLIKKKKEKKFKQFPF
ncbi:MAG: hypothetical protein BAJALOKI2v1_780016 [Promethearchaeota archaeon]|nr:MAG: hypothetical protein BAJALOKI2v1_780016 [Candidatus Lokiarchaeota archaeon]